jgi:hypothetical protein
MAINFKEIKKRCAFTVDPMRREFDNIKGGLLDIARNVYPLGIKGLSGEVENYSKRSETFDDDEMLTTIPLEALRKGAAGFLVNLMNPALKWFNLREEVDSGNGAQLEVLEDFVADTMKKSGSYRAFKKIFEHLLAFGFGCIIIKEDEANVCRAECLRVGTYSFGIGNDGKVNRVERRFCMTPEEIVREFGGGANGRAVIPENVMNLWKQGIHDDSANIVIRNLIEPNEKAYVVGGDEEIDYGLSKSMKYRSIFWIEGASDGSDRAGILSIRGFKFNPIVAPRLDCEFGGIYGRGRGHDALNACRGCQALRWDEMMISSNRAEPPVIASNDFREEGLGLGRGQVTFANLGEQRNEMVIPVLPNPPTSDETRAALAELQQEVKEMFFNGEFQTIDSLKTVAPGDKRTAAEINALKSENMMTLGGIILMLDDELLDPVVNIFTRYALASRKWKRIYGKAMSGVKWMPTYMSNLHLAQRTQEINSTENSVFFAAQVAGIGTPEATAVLDNFNFDRIVRKHHELVGGSILDLNDEDVIAKTRDDRAKAQAQEQAIMAQQAQSEQALAQAKAANQAASADETEMRAQMLGGDVPFAMGGY